MMGFALLLALAAPSGASAPTWEARVRLALGGLELPEVLSLAVRPRAQQSESVALPPILDRHLFHTEQIALPGGGTLELAGTLGIPTGGNEDAYLSVIVPGGRRYTYEMKASMGGRFDVNGRSYEVDLEVNIFRPAHDNVIVIKDAAGAPIWRRTVRQLFRASYNAGRALHLNGREYRLFYSNDPRTRQPILCFVYDTPRKYHFFIFPVTQLQRGPTSYNLYNGEQIRLQVSSDRSTLLIHP